MAEKILFDNVAPVCPMQQLAERESEDLTTRVMDLLTPIGKGQHGLIVAASRQENNDAPRRLANTIARKTTKVSASSCSSTSAPREVTDMQRTVKGEVISSTFDEPPSDTSRWPTWSSRRPSGLVEHKRDVVILLDWLTRFARAHNAIIPSSGKVFSGGLNANALQRPRRFFATARNIEEGSSLSRHRHGHRGHGQPPGAT